MNVDLGNTWDSIKDGTKEVAETAHEKTSEFHETYVSKVLPDCGKYGDVAKFIAEMAPGVSEYDALVDGDWTAFAIAAGIDVTAFAVGVATLGTGYVAVKGGSTVAKAGTKVAVKEIAEAGAKKAVKETVETGAKKAVKETAEAGIKKTTKEVAESGIEKTVKNVVESGTEKSAKIVSETGIEKTVKEASEVATKELDEVSLVVKNKLDGIEREVKVLDDLVEKFGENNVIREAILRDANGVPIKDIVTDSARRIDFVVIDGDKVIKSIEVTSETASKAFQVAKESRIIKQAEELGGVFIKNPVTGELISFGNDVVTEIVRLQ